MTETKPEDKPDIQVKGITPRIIEDEMQKSYLNYSMSVIVGRALPDVRDGLKPVHRRILYAMSQLGMTHDKPFKKCARIVGEVLGKYHPHGDVAVYDSLVRMAQDFSLRYPLINGQGNFGSIDGDSPAAMRYTEARLHKIAEEMLEDLEKNTVIFAPNFDNTLKEPTVLPSKLPNLLINGSSGIAVGMATNIPPHNVTEVCDTAIKLIDNNEISDDELISTIKGPDFPTGGMIIGRAGIYSMYKTGRGKVLVRAKTHIEQKGKEKNIIIVDEIPYAVNKSELVKEIANLIRDKKVNGITDLRDESDRKGIRIVFELKQGMNPETVLNQLFRQTRLETTFGVIMLAIVGKKPKVLDLRNIIYNYIAHRKEIITLRTKFDLDKAKARLHIVEGLLIALRDIDKTVDLIKKSKSVDEAREKLIANFNLSLEQVNAILDMKLQRITSLEQGKLKDEAKELMEKIKEFESILASEQKILNIIKADLEEMKKKYGDKRRTEIVEQENERVSDEKLVEEEESVITISYHGYVKRTPVAEYKQQSRGGKGIIAAGTKEEDFVSDLFSANSRDNVLFFTNKGKLQWMKVYEIPKTSRQAKGSALVNLLKLEENEKVTTFIPVKNFSGYLIMITKKGIIKKTELAEFSNQRAGGIRAINLRDNDELVNVILTDGKRKLLIATANGFAVRFDEQKLRQMGRSASGVRGARLREKDEVIQITASEDEDLLMSITENGYGKRTKISLYPMVNRGGKGVIDIKCSERNGNVVAALALKDTDDVMVVTKNGISIRFNANDINVVGRNTQGVRLIKLDAGDKVVSAVVIKGNGENNS